MDFGTKVRVAVALLLFTDALFRLLFANIRLPAIPIFPLPSRKRTREDDDDDFVGLIEGGAVCLGMKRRRFWCARRGHGVWDDEIIANWNVMGRDWDVRDWEDAQYRQHLRMTKVAFWKLHRKVGNHLEKQITKYRLPVSSAKRLAIIVHYLAHALSYATLSLLYGIGTSTTANIIQEGVAVIKHILLPTVIKFPTGQKLRRTMRDFKALCGLPRCAGAIDGTFMRIRKPVLHGDAYWCYKHYTTILVLAVVDGDGKFTYVDAGRAGSLGDAATFHASRLERNILDNTWLTIPERAQNANHILGTYIRPYLVGDAAFPLSPTLMKCFDDRHGPLQPHERTFNFRLIRTRRVVEQAFGRLKARFRILEHSNINRPRFAADVALVCCGLHNFCEGFRSQAGEAWQVDVTEYQPGRRDIFHVDSNGTGQVTREKLARHIHMRRPV